MAIALIASIVYISMSGTNSASNPISTNNFVVNSDGDKQEAKRPENIITIEYNSKDLDEFTDGANSLDAKGWTLFHELLIENAGYDPDEIRNDDNMMVSFHAHDDDVHAASIDLQTLSDEDLKAYRSRVRPIRTRRPR